VRMRKSRALTLLARFASLGYAVPGAVLAIGILFPFGLFDNALDRFMRDTFGVSTGLLLSGTIAALLFAYVVRFLALAYGTLEAGLGRVTPHMDDAARTLKHGPAKALIKVNLPIIRGSIMTAAILIFVDSMKELPATLLLRPFNFDTLATYVYQFASDELLEECALGALTIVAAGVIPVILLTRVMSRRRPDQEISVV
ncbi:MAG: iron ABC transporter permease, partial [Alphaproteobacteria bacterium]|nr:iron ABC transporter permease [Alphaproteobacteria bacterium]